MRRLRKWKKLVWLFLVVFLGIIYVLSYVHNTKRSENSESANNELASAENYSWNFDVERYIGKRELLTSDPYLRHAFNVHISDLIPVDRVIPNTRDTSCINEKRGNMSPIFAVSVVISFHNEARSTLLRTIVSILNRSPDQFLKEVILIDDFSDDALAGQELSSLPKVRLYRNEKRSGLAKSRAFGAEHSSGDYIFFLDSHCEVNVDWLQPLVHNLEKYPKSIASPVIDIIDLDTFEYKASSGDLKGGIDWKLDFKWQQLTNNEKLKRTSASQPFQSPILPGGVFMVKRSWFIEIGGFDKGLEIWGAENIELSLKNWLCGEGVYVVPCSRVGHVFRKRHPYSFPPNGSAAIYLRNARRIAAVWLDEHEEQFYRALPKAKSHIAETEITEQLGLKKRLHCKNFQWFLDNIYSELKPHGKDSLALGKLQQGDLCLEAHFVEQKNSTKFRLLDCKESSFNEEWSFLKNGLLKVNRSCMTSEGIPNGKIYLSQCKVHENQRWMRQQRLLIHQQSGLCLESTTSIKTTVQLGHCHHKIYNQQWDFSIELQKWGDR